MITHAPSIESPRTGRTDVKFIVQRLRLLSSPEAVKGMARFGITIKKAYGVSIPNLRKIAKEMGKSHETAQKLWATGIHEARILAGMIDEPGLVTEKQMEIWVKDFDSWDVCDQVCSNLFDKTTHAYKKAIEWSGRKNEFVKRAGFVLMATLAVHDKGAEDPHFIQFFPLIARESTDERLRGRRSRATPNPTIETAAKIAKCLGFSINR